MTTKVPLPATQAIKVEIGISQTILRSGGLSLLKEKNKTIEETLEMTIIGPSSKFPAFLTQFDSLEFNSLPASHFHCFRPPYSNFLQFSMPGEGLPLLEGLFRVHRDFISEFRGGVIFREHSNGAPLCYAGFLEGHLS